MGMFVHLLQNIFIRRTPFIGTRQETLNWTRTLDPMKIGQIDVEFFMGF